ncbi:hypothetical protein SODALDRAFT_377910 [Sodiomyces alkalinus F11]|uniref:Uncharacterized protein n=1 Tax=Sodiomyces alkalinus (strain CBS 110278 / VKM F-3762 / F11) TaxID=1314773 RepID=A0A3N2PZS1_SODAK|nr:hypothetical protein SODALDRAFT_377910 [Sodiomyces alkalinus F11]ROT40020.1 hypothetical protein SODALDRAFT_377910 [Sodiomyces alkalinus F11]
MANSEPSQSSSQPLERKGVQRALDVKGSGRIDSPKEGARSTPAPSPFPPAQTEMPQHLDRGKISRTSRVWSLAEGPCTLQNPTFRLQWKSVPVQQPHPGTRPLAAEGVQQQKEKEDVGSSGEARLLDGSLGHVGTREQEQEEDGDTNGAKDRVAKAAKSDADETAEIAEAATRMGLWVIDPSLADAILQGDLDMNRPNCPKNEILQRLVSSWHGFHRPGIHRSTETSITLVEEENEESRVEQGVDATNDASPVNDVTPELLDADPKSCGGVGQNGLEPTHLLSDPRFPPTTVLDVSKIDR